MLVAITAIHNLDCSIVFPVGWHGRELPPIIGLTVIIHPGNESEPSSPFAISIPSTQSQMLLQVINSSDLADLGSEKGTKNINDFVKYLGIKEMIQKASSSSDSRSSGISFGGFKIAT
jgi:hypothetical protein